MRIALGLLLATCGALAPALPADATISLGWTNGPPVPVARMLFGLVALPDGSALALGGATTGGDTATVERFDPHSNTWRNAGALGTARSHVRATVLADGRVFVAGAPGHGRSSEIYDPATETSAAVASSRLDHRKHREPHRAPIHHGPQHGPLAHIAPRREFARHRHAA